MYTIIVKKDDFQPRLILAEDIKELSAIVIYAPYSGYEILEVKFQDFELGTDFLDEINKKIKPDDLVYGEKS